MPGIAIYAQLHFLLHFYNDIDEPIVILLTEITNIETLLIWKISV